jgi:hypothetical protein
LNPQVEASFRSHRHHKADVKRAPRSARSRGELTHGAERTRNRNCNRSALPANTCPFSGGRLQAGSESSLFIDCGLSIFYLLVSSMNIQSALKQVASLKFIVSFLRRRCRFGSGFKSTFGFCLLVRRSRSAAVTASTSFCAAKAASIRCCASRASVPPQTFEVRAAGEQPYRSRLGRILLRGPLLLQLRGRRPPPLAGLAPDSAPAPPQ